MRLELSVVMKVNKRFEIWLESTGRDEAPCFIKEKLETIHGRLIVQLFLRVRKAAKLQLSSLRVSIIIKESNNSYGHAEAISSRSHTKIDDETAKKVARLLLLLYKDWRRAP